MTNNSQNTNPRAAAPTAGKVRVLELPATLTVKQLAESLQVSPVDIVKQLMRGGIMANINQSVDFEAASAVAAADSPSRNRPAGSG